jgi:hypothetical protein
MRCIIICIIYQRLGNRFSNCGARTPRGGRWSSGGGGSWLYEGHKMMMGEWWIGKGYGRKRYYPGICLERMKKTTKILRQHSQSPSRDLNPRPLTHETGALTTLPRRSVRDMYCARNALEMLTKCWSETLKGTHHLEDLGADGRI